MQFLSVRSIKRGNSTATYSDERTIVQHSEDFLNKYPCNAVPPDHTCLVPLLIPYKWHEAPSIRVRASTVQPNLPLQSARSRCTVTVHSHASFDDTARLAGHSMSGTPSGAPLQQPLSTLYNSHRSMPAATMAASSASSWSCAQRAAVCNHPHIASTSTRTEAFYDRMPHATYSHA